MPIESSQPTYDRSLLTPGILHVGTGAFHRAHQAVYTDSLLKEDPRWGIVGSSLRSTRLAEQLKARGYLYTVETRSQYEKSYRTVASVLDVITASTERDRLIDTIADPEIRVITLTITEKGYCATSAGDLDLSLTDVKHDIEHPHEPITAAGILAAGLARRMVRHNEKLTVLSCDNLSANGKVIEKVLTDFAEAANPQLTGWMNDHVTFPCSMVDRIVPMTTDADIKAAYSVLGYEDPTLVVAEPFSQWVIEDHFAGDRPAWDSVGAEYVASVEPYEHTKLRVLNASHSALAYFGLLQGYTYIHEAVKDQSIRREVEALLEREVIPVLEPPPRFDIHGYKESVLKRFENSAVPYRTQQVATDGSKKLVQRILPTLAARKAHGLDSPIACKVIAAWKTCLEDPDIQFDDPFVAGGNLREVFGPVAQDPELVNAINRG